MVSEDGPFFSSMVTVSLAHFIKKLGCGLVTVGMGGKERKGKYRTSFILEVWWKKDGRLRMEIE